MAANGESGHFDIDCTDSGLKRRMQQLKGRFVCSGAIYP